MNSYTERAHRMSDRALADALKSAEDLAWRIVSHVDLFIDKATADCLDALRSETRKRRPACPGCAGTGEAHPMSERYCDVCEGR